MGRRLKVRIETAGLPNDEVARLLRDVARRVDDGRVRGLIERDGRAVGAWSFEDDVTVISERAASQIPGAKVGSLSR
jgi:hypothetical protein